MIKLVKIQKLLFCTGLLAWAGLSQAAEQTITFDPAAITAGIGAEGLSITASYEASDAATTSGVGISLYFDSSKLTFVSLAGNADLEDFLISSTATPDSIQDDSGDADEDETTDKKAIIAFAHLIGKFPASGEVFTVVFNVNDDIAVGSTSVNVTLALTAGYDGVAVPVVVTIVADADNDGQTDDIDTDDDNDGVLDEADAFPFDETESIDTDGDQIGNNADTDDDNDGILDVDDTFPLDATNTPLITTRLFNIATRGFIGTGDNVLIGGVIISGTENKTVVIRAKGPSLADFAVPGVLPDPQMVLFSGATQINSNDDWELHDNMNLVPDSLKPTNSLEAVIVTTLAPGAYTAIVSGVNDEEGIGIIEVFELDNTGSTRIINIATRGFVGTGDSVLIAGLIVTGTGTGKVVIRAKGPSLTAFGVAGALDDPKITIFQGATAIDTNDNWKDHADVANVPDNLKPDNDLEATIYKELPPGAYTAIVEGVGGATGVGIVEVFAVD